MSRPDVTAERTGALSAAAEVVVVNDEGMHLRPATRFAELSTKCGCIVRVRTDRGEADGRSVLELAMLAAPKGTVLAITVEGDGCERALADLTSLVAGGFGR